MMTTFAMLKAANAWRYAGNDHTPVRDQDTSTRDSILTPKESAIEKPVVVIKNCKANVLVSKDLDSEEEGKKDTPQSSPTSSSAVGGRVRSVVHVSNGANDGDDDHLPYIQLDPDFAKELCWSNHPGDLGLQTYFRPTKPNLETDYNIPGLRPVLREPDGFNRFLLKDPQDRFYIWDEDDHLWWVMEEGVDEQESLEDKVDFVMCRYGALDVEPVYQNYHPAGDTVKVEMFRKNGSRYQI